MVPPIISTMFLLMAIPSPVPCILLTVEVRSRSKGSKIFGKLRTHADAVVADAELILPAAADLAGKLAHPQRHRTPAG